MKNVQISFDETLLSKIDRIAASSQLSRSAIVREALLDWLREKNITAFEQEWIPKLKGKPKNPKHLEPWIMVGYWEDK
jgi:predicted transcriptional regulator